MNKILIRAFYNAFYKVELVSNFINACLYLGHSIMNLLFKERIPGYFDVAFNALIVINQVPSTLMSILTRIDNAALGLAALGN